MEEKSLLLRLERQLLVVGSRRSFEIVAFIKRVVAAGYLEFPGRRGVEDQSSHNTRTTSFNRRGGEDNEILFGPFRVCFLCDLSAQCRLASDCLMVNSL
jgi:hypothetical protein